MRKYWIAGVAIAACGILLARVVVRLFPQPLIELGVYILGVTLALAGLAIIMLGLGKKARGGS